MSRRKFLSTTAWAAIAGSGLANLALHLAGHTHGGFWDVPRVTSTLFRAAGMPHVAGWYDVGATKLYVNAGIGASVVRRRIGPAAMPEVAVFDLG